MRDGVCCILYLSDGLDIGSLIDQVKGDVHTLGGDGGEKWRAPVLFEVMVIT